MLDTVKLLNQFNAAARNLQHEEINNLGNHILELGENEYPVSVLAAVDTRVNNNKRICHNYQAIIESMGEEDKTVMRRLAPKIIKKRPGVEDLSESYRTFNKKEDNIEHMWLGKPNELFLKCKNNFNPQAYQQQINSLEKVRSLKVLSQQYAGDGKKVIGIKLTNELSPVIIYTQQIYDNKPEECGEFLEFIPLPSLLQNGTHYSELVSYGQNKKNLEALHGYHRDIFNKKSTRKINNINIHPQTRDSICTSLNNDWCTWLEDVQGITINDKVSANNNKISLNLEEYTYPTFSILFKGCEETEIVDGNFKREILISDSTTYTPLLRYSIVTNKLVNGIDNQLQTQYPNCISENGLHFSACNNMPMCVHTNTLKSNVQEDSEVHNDREIQIVVDVKQDDINGIRLFLFTLMNQKGITPIKIILCGKKIESQELATEVAKDFNIKDMHCCSYSELRNYINPNHLVLFSSVNIILEKEDTINKLISQFKPEIMGSASCKITYIDIDSEKIKEKKSSSGQLLKEKNDTKNTDIVEIHTENSFNQIHGTYFNVIANNYDFTLINGKDIVYSKLVLDDIQKFICSLTLNFAIESRINTVDTTIKVYCTSQETLDSEVWMGVNKVRLESESWDTYGNRVSNETQLLP